jgi:hypothetical protein
VQHTRPDHAPSDASSEGDQPHPSLLSQSDPPPDTGSTRPPLLLVVAIVLVVTAVVVLHLTGVLGPGSH